MAGNNDTFVDPATRTKTFYGSLELIKGKHNHIPSRTDEDPSVRERGFFKTGPEITERLRGDADEREFLQYLQP